MSAPFGIEDMEQAVQETMLECRRNSMSEVDALIMAGWRYELPEIVNRKEGEPASKMSSEPWQWYWRSPPKRKGSRGQKYWSTTMAYNSLQRKIPAKP